MRYHGTNSDGETLSSMYVEKLDSEQFGLDCSNLPSLTRQEFADECDINNLMAQYEKSGVISHVNKTPPQYLDLSETPDLQTAINIIRDAETAFMTLPAKTRAEFENNPVEFIKFAENPENLKQMQDWGLAPVPAPEAPPQKVEIINPPEPAK